MKVYEQVAGLLHDHGVDTIFGLIGDANMYIAASFEGNEGTFVRVAHEAGAVSMADGYARLGQRPGVATVTHGPGFTNALTALVEATRSSTSVLLITGDTPPEATHLQRLDIAAVCASLGVVHERVHRADTVARDVNRAWRRLADGPVVLNVPLSLSLEEATAGGLARSILPALATRAAAEAVDEALGVLASSARPIIVAGRGATSPAAEAAIAQLADLVGAPLFTTALGRGLFGEHERHVGIMGSLSNEVAVQLIADSDCVLAFGASLNKYTTMRGELLSGSRVVQVDNDPVKLGWLVEPDVRVLGDTGEVAQLMRSRLAEAELTFGSTWRQRGVDVSRAVSEWTPSDDRSAATTVDVRLASQALNAVLPSGAVVVSDVGRFVAGVWPYLSGNRPGDFTAMTGFGAIGLGLAAGIGAALARPEERTVVLAGDGGFMMNVSELSTAVRERLPIIILVFNDGAFGAEYQKLASQGFSPTVSYNIWPDLCDVARGFGVQAIKIQSLSDVSKVGEILSSIEGPLIVDVRIDPTHHIEF